MGLFKSKGEKLDENYNKGYDLYQKGEYAKAKAVLEKGHKNFHYSSALLLAHILYAHNGPIPDYMGARSVLNIYRKQYTEAARRYDYLDRHNPDFQKYEADIKAGKKPAFEPSLEYKDALQKTTGIRLVPDDTEGKRERADIGLMKDDPPAQGIVPEDEPSGIAVRSDDAEDDMIQIENPEAKGGFVFVFNDDRLTASLDKCDSTDENVKVPPYVRHNGKKYKVVSVNYGSFWGNGAIKTVYIPRTVTEGAEKVKCDTLQEIRVDRSNPVYRSVDGVLFSKDGSRLLAYPRGRLADSYAIPEGTVTVAYAAFWCSKLKSVTLPSTLTNFDDSPFGGSEYLNEIKLNSNPNYVLMDGILFTSDMKKLIYCPPNSMIPSYTIPGTVKEICGHAFNYCSSLEYLILPEGLTEINYGTFANCRSLKRITLPRGLKTIGSEVFSDCGALRSVELPDGLESIGSFTFCNSGLEHISIPNSVKSIGYCAFNFCDSLESAVMSSKTQIDRECFDSKVKVNTH